MNKLYFKNKYRISSTRHPGWNYASDGFYYVTICTHHKITYFGKVKNCIMLLSYPGKIAEKHWLKIPDYYNGKVELDEFIVMPSHLHGIVIIKNNIPEAGLGYKRDFGPLEKCSLSIIINQFKRGVKKFCNENNLNFLWQARYYDRVIRDEDELNRIRQYIIDNPANWSLDENNPKNF